MIKIKSGDAEINITTEQAKEIVRKLNADEIMDAIKHPNVSCNKSTILGRIFENYDRCNLLHEFFNSKSDNAKTLTAENQEAMEVEFQEWLNDYHFH